MPSFSSSVVVSLRRKIVAAARWGIANEPRIHYGQVRPIPLGTTLPLTTDCSGFVTICFYEAGAPDPNGLDHLEAIERADAGRGDVVIWGAYPGRHCAIVLEPGVDPLLASHGRERGPIAIRYTAECRLQPSLVTWLDALSRGRPPSSL